MHTDNRHAIPEILLRQPLFRTLNGADLLGLAHGTQELKLDAASLLFQKGDESQGMYLVVSGQIRLYLPSPSGAEKVVHMAGPGETFGEECLFQEKSHPVAAEAVRDSVVLRVDRMILLRAIETNPALMRAMMARMCSRIHDLVEDMETSVQRSSAQRVAYYLTQQAPRAVERWHFELENDKQTIASQLNLAPETLSRVLSRMVRDGYIRMKGRSIDLMNPDALRSYAG